jgi:hypothetical protein
VGGGLDPATACRVARVCVVTCSPNPYEPVCGRDFATYRNACELGAAGAQALHRGACQWNEGRPCDSVPCPGAQYCRRDDVAGARCTQRGACVVDADCPAGLDEAPVCEADGGLPWRCDQGTCRPSCR